MTKLEKQIKRYSSKQQKIKWKNHTRDKRNYKKVKEMLKYTPVSMSLNMEKSYLKHKIETFENI